MAEQTQSMTGANQADGQQSQPRGQGRDNQLARWDPFAFIDDVQEQMARLWGRPFGFGPMPRSVRRLAHLPSSTTFAPRVDVFEKDGNLVVQAELPGIKKEDVQVELVDGDLVVRGESRDKNEVKEENYYRIERTAGSFYRRLPLGFPVQPDQIQASMSDGVLEVRIPEPAEQKSTAKPIPVR